MSSIPPTYAAVTAGTHHPKQQVMGPSNGNNFQPGHQASAGGNKSVGKETSTKSILKEIIEALSSQPGKAAELASQLLMRVGSAQACHIKEFMKLTPEQQKAVNFYDSYSKESEERGRYEESAKSTFVSRTNKFFGDKFKQEIKKVVFYLSQCHTVYLDFLTLRKRSTQQR